MNSSTNLLRLATQIRLCAVFIDRETLHPLKGLSVYAEARATITALRPPIKVGDLEMRIYKSLYNDDFSEEQCLEIKNVLVKYLTEHYGQPSDEDLQTIVNEITNAVIQHKEALLQDFNLVKIEELISAILYALIKEQKITAPHLDERSTPKAYFIPFGYLATDQVGYVSFDIEKSIKSYLELDEDSQLDVEYWMYPNGDLNAGINVSALARVTLDYVFGNIALPKPLTLINNNTYHSLQNPNLIDWYLSPSSFSINPKYFIGEDGCEQLYPVNFATSEFRFFQIVRGNEIHGTAGVRKGFALEYHTSWQPLGHTLGQIIYSLPLAPGEIVKIGIIDWSRNSEDSRQEETTVSEELTHDTYRDRTITETVEAALKEWQRGGSVMGGNSGGAGASFGMGMFGAAAGNAHSFGGGYSTSSGDRDFTASTVQQVNDAFSQHSTAIRELRSTIVVQSEQKEYARAETRVIANNNHSHALTMLYYEVLRHYKVTTEFSRLRNVLLVDYSGWGIDFNNEYEINRYRKVLEMGLLEQRYLPYFDAVHLFLAAIGENDFEYNKTPQTEDQANVEFSEFRITFFTGDDGFGENDAVHFDLHTASAIVRFFEIGKEATFDLHRPFSQGSRKEILVKAAGGLIIKWKDINKFVISVRCDGDENWRLQTFTLEGLSTANVYRTLFSEDLNVLLEDDAGNNTEAVKFVSRDVIRPTYSLPKPNHMERLSPEHRINVSILKIHLMHNAGYYTRLIWLNEDPNDRARRFEEITIDNGQLIDKIENRPIEVLGNYVAFPSNYEVTDRANPDFIREIKKAKMEKLMTLPTRGVFAEAKLGHCNASEVIDNTRFWDWQQSPILEKAPEIDPLSTESRNVTQNLTPTPFPGSIVNIVNPSAAPDPTAMAGALSLLGKADIFRDMSMSKEVNDLLKKLSDNAVSMAEAATQARGILQDQNNGGGSTGSGGGNGAGNNGSSGSGNTTTPASTAPTKEETESKEIDNAQKTLEVAKAELTPKQQQVVREKVTRDLSTEDKFIHIELQTADQGGIIDVVEPADYDINQQYMGKLSFVGGTATIKTKNQNGSFHIKLKGKVPNIPGRAYFSQIPGYENQSGEYHFESNCFFKFPAGESSVLLHGALTVKTSEAVVHADAGGTLTLEGGGGFSLPVKVVKVDLSSKVEVVVNGQVGYKMTYKIESITGLSLKQV